MIGSLSFLAPLGFLAALALAAIVVLHMRRRTPIHWAIPSLRFWIPAREDQSERSRLRRPPITLPLILQLFAALCIVLALARPVVPDAVAFVDSRITPVHTVIVLDGSTSMGAAVDSSSSTTRFAHARDAALERLDDWQPGDVTTVLVAGQQIQTFGVSNQDDLSETRSSLSELSLPGGEADLGRALTLANNVLLPDRSADIVLISDGSSPVDAGVAEGLNAPVELVSVPDVDAPLETNTAITSISASAARSGEGGESGPELAFTIAHYSDETETVPFTVQADGLDIAADAVTLDPDEERTIVVSLPEGTERATATIQTIDVLQADNRATISLQQDALASLDVLLISDTPSAILRAVESIPGANVTIQDGSTSGLRAQAAPYDLVVFEGISPPPEETPEVPMVFLQPQPVAEHFAQSGTMTDPSIGSVSAGDPMLEGVDLAGATFGNMPAYDLAADEEALVTATDDEASGPLIWRGEFEGQPYVSYAFALSESNITDRVAFPILVARTVESLTSERVPASLGIGQSVEYTPRSAATTVEISGPSGEPTSIDVEPEAERAVTFSETNQAGSYTLRELSTEGDVLHEGEFIVNAGSPTESNLRPQPELAEMLSGDVSEAGMGQDLASRSEFWPLLVIGALAVILAEWIAATRDAGRRGSRGASASANRGGTAS